MRKAKQPELKKVDELEEMDSVERLKVNRHGAEGEEKRAVDPIDGHPPTLVGTCTPHSMHGHFFFRNWMSVTYGNFRKRLILG